MPRCFIIQSDMPSTVNHRPIAYAVGAISLIAYSLIAYAFPRSEFGYLISCFSILFGGYYYFIRVQTSFSEKEILGLAILFRVILVGSIPTLTDDFYRYLWDGQLVLKGINPFAYTPTEAIEHGLMSSSVFYEKMNSPDFYSVYPPTNQLVFALSALGGSLHASVFVLKIVALAAEIGTLVFITKISRHFKQGNVPLVVYGLNPLVILEFSGNAHSEAFMLFFIALFVFLFIKKRNALAGISLAFAICSKLIPVLILPLLITKIGWKNGLKLGAIAVGFSVLLFIPFISPAVLNAQKGLSLYFNHFEFYGAIYQLGKWLNGYFFTGFDRVIKLLALVLIGFIYTRPIVSTQELLRSSLLVFTVYFLFSSTIHPWYIAALVFYGAFTQLHYVLIWSFTCCFTYITYQTKAYLQSPWVLWLQFFVVVFFIIRELKQMNAPLKSSGL